VAVGLVIMSERELNRVEVLAQVGDDRMNVTATGFVEGLIQALSRVQSLLEG